MKTKYKLYSILDLALVSEGYTLKQTYISVLELAQYAESYGYTLYWLAEQHYAPNIGNSATSVLISYVAQGTNTLRIGFRGIMLPKHSLLIIAE